MSPLAAAAAWNGPTCDSSRKVKRAAEPNCTVVCKSFSAFDLGKLLKVVITIRCRVRCRVLAWMFVGLKVAPHVLLVPIEPIVSDDCHGKFDPATSVNIFPMGVIDTNQTSCYSGAAFSQFVREYVA